jgi:hypothetical protein
MKYKTLVQDISFVSKRSITRQILPDRRNAVNGVLLAIKRNAVHAVYMVLICVGSVPFILDLLKNSVYRTPIQKEGMLLYTPSYSAERDAVYSEVILQKGMLYPANLPQSMGMLYMVYLFQ